MEQTRRYELVRNIASGGMAQVYEARLIATSGFKRRVALKRMLPQHTRDQSMQSMFFDEARVVSQLHHGNIVQVIDFGEVDDCQFIAMEYVDGVDAGQALKRAEAMADHMPEGVALHVIAEAAHALDYAHNCRDDQDVLMSIIHRDISPHNILLSWRGDVKLSDFGIALSRDRSELTRTGVIKGKLHYMPPEQAFGEMLTSAVDVFAIGVTLQVMIAGSATLPTDPGTCVVSTNLSSSVAELVSDCTNHDPARRPDAAAVAERAGRLAAEALGRGGRSGLSEWLEPLRESFGGQSKLDDLMGLSLVMVGPNKFTVSSDRPAGKGELSRTLPPLAAPVTGTSDTGPASPPRLPVGLITISLLLGALIVAGIALWPSGQPSPSDVAQISKLAKDASLPPKDIGTPPVDRSVPDVRPVDVSRPDVKRRPRKPRRFTKRTPSKKIHEPPKPVVTKKGWLKIGGSLLVNGRVTLDGKPFGFAPLAKQVLVGQHKVVVYDAKGKILLDVSVPVSEQNNKRSNAVRLIRRAP